MTIRIALSCCGGYYRLRRCWQVGGDPAGTGCRWQSVYINTSLVEPGDRIRYNGSCYTVMGEAIDSCVNLPRADIRVTGSGDGASIDGLYTNELNSGWPHPDTACSIWSYTRAIGGTIQYSGGRWGIGGRYFNDDDSLIPPLTGWYAGNGALPVPNVAYEWSSGGGSGSYPEPTIIDSPVWDDTCGGFEQITVVVSGILPEDQCCDFAPQVESRKTITIDVDGTYASTWTGCENVGGNLDRTNPTIGPPDNDPTDSVQRMWNNNNCSDPFNSDSTQTPYRFFGDMDGEAGTWSPEIRLAAGGSNKAFFATDVAWDDEHANETDLVACGTYPGQGGTLTTARVEVVGDVNHVHYYGGELFLAGDIDRPEQGQRDGDDGRLNVGFDDDGLGGAVPAFDFCLGYAYNANREVAWTTEVGKDLYSTTDTGSILWSTNTAASPKAVSRGTTTGFDELAVATAAGVEYFKLIDGSSIGTFDNTLNVNYIVPDALGWAHFIALESDAAPIRSIAGLATTNWTCDPSGQGDTQSAKACFLNADMTLFVAMDSIATGDNADMTLFAINSATGAVLDSIDVGYGQLGSAPICVFAQDEREDDDPGAEYYVYVGGPQLYLGGDYGVIFRFHWNGSTLGRSWKWRPLSNTYKTPSCLSITGENDGTSSRIYAAISQTGGLSNGGGTAGYDGQFGLLYAIRGKTKCVHWKLDRFAVQEWYEN